MATTAPVADPLDDVPRRISAPVSAGDRVFRGVLRAAGLSVFAGLLKIAEVKAGVVTHAVTRWAAAASFRLAHALDAIERERARTAGGGAGWGRSRSDEDGQFRYHRASP